VTLADETDAFGQPRARLSLRMGELETRTVAVVGEFFARALGMADEGRMRIEFDPSDSGWMNEVGWQYHHCGGTRMHSDPRKGVVDANCRVHGLANLYVAGSSVFPTSGHANPTMNLLAFALRLADHLKEEFAN
jgi:choline dehydrogenase-like flavoprotein